MLEISNTRPRSITLVISITIYGRINFNLLFILLSTIIFSFTAAQHDVTTVGAFTAQHIFKDEPAGLESLWRRVSSPDANSTLGDSLNEGSVFVRYPTTLETFRKSLAVAAAWSDYSSVESSECQQNIAGKTLVNFVLIPLLNIFLNISFRQLCIIASASFVFLFSWRIWMGYPQCRTAVPNCPKAISILYVHITEMFSKSFKSIFIGLCFVKLVSKRHFIILKNDVKESREKPGRKLKCWVLISRSFTFRF